MNNFFILKQIIWVENTIKKEENQTSQPKAKSSESVSRSVMSDSLGPPWTIVHQTPLSMGFCR